MLDILYIALTLALFALVSLAAAGVDRLGPHVRGTAHPVAAHGGTHDSTHDTTAEEARS